MREPRRKGAVVALSGGIGGAKLAWGLANVVAQGDLTIVANTADDFEHLGLSISPDIDTLLYTLSGLADPTRGWGRRDETWTFMGALNALGGLTWFQLGDGDLAMHVERTRRLRAGETLSAVTATLCSALKARGRILPMSDDPVRTMIDTIHGRLEFQDWFVARRCEPAVRAVTFSGVEMARPQVDALALLADPALRAVVICPSNPFISIGPILAIPGMRAALAACAAPIVAVSPIVGGKAVKGPTAKMMAELGLPVTSGAAMKMYGGLLDAVLAEPVDAEEDHGAPVTAARTLMENDDDKIELARRVLAVADKTGVVRRER